jgi:hypothetical protein
MINPCKLLLQEGSVPKGKHDRPILYSRGSRFREQLPKEGSRSKKKSNRCSRKIKDDDSDASKSYGQDETYFNFTMITFAADAIETKEICVATGSGEASIVIKREYYHTDTICVAAPPDNQVL